MDRKQPQKRSINVFLSQITIFPIVFFIVLLGGVAAFSILYINTGMMLYFYLLLAFGILFSGAYVFFSVFTSRKFNELFVKGLYDITLTNLRNMTDNENELESYPGNSYQEFVSLNKEVETLKKELDTSTLIANAVDFSHIALDYFDFEHNVVYLKSFKKKNITK